MIDPSMGLSAYPIELTPPDLEQYRVGNTGVPFFHRWDSGKPGPSVMISAIIHGNELCGALALDFLHRSEIRPTSGSLTVGFCNVAAYGAFDPDYPALSRFIEDDLNRVWDVETLDDAASSLELNRARAIRPLLDKTDYLLDLHSMQHATQPMLLAGTTEKGRELAARVGYPNTVVMDPGHASGTRMRDYDFFSDPTDSRTALLVECGQHWEVSAAIVARETMLRFLMALGVVSVDQVRDHLTQPLGLQNFIRVTDSILARSPKFRFVNAFGEMETVKSAGTVIAHDGDDPVVTPYDDCVLVLPAGRLAPGQTAVRLGHISERKAH